MVRQMMEIPAACTRALRQLGISGINQLVCGRFTAFRVEAVKGVHLVYAIEEAPKADQLTRKPKVILAAREKAITPVIQELCLSSRRRSRRTPLAHGFYAGVFVGSFSRFFFAVCSCFFIFCFRALSLSFLPLSPIAYLLFPLFRFPGSRPQPAKSRWLLSLMPAPWR